MIPNRNGRVGALPFGELGRLGKHFVLDLEHDYREHGEGVIEGLRKNHPITYVKLLLALSPKYGNGDETWLAFENALMEKAGAFLEKWEASQQHQPAPAQADP